MEKGKDKLTMMVEGRAITYKELRDANLLEKVLSFYEVEGMQEFERVLSKIQKGALSQDQLEKVLLQILATYDKQ